MPAKKPAVPFVISDALIRAFATNNRIDMYLVTNVPEEAWRAKPPGGKGRDIASIAAHMHNVRLMWLKAAAASDIPAKLEPATVTQEQSVTAMETSSKSLEDTLRASLTGDGNVKSFKPDVVSFLFGMWEWGTR